MARRGLSTPWSWSYAAREWMDVGFTYLMTDGASVGRATHVQSALKSSIGAARVYIILPTPEQRHQVQD